MVAQPHEVEFETRAIGPLVLTTPVLQRLGFREMVNRYCPIAEQADWDHGLVAELVVQSRLSDPGALYDLPGWAERYALPALYPEVERAGQLNDDRAGRMLDAIYDQRAFIWGELVAKAAGLYQLDLSRLHADTMALTFAGLFADQPAVEGVPCLEPGYNPAGEWLQQLKLFALASGDGGLPVWFDTLDGGTGDSTTYITEPGRNYWPPVRAGKSWPMWPSERRTSQQRSGPSTGVWGIAWMSPIQKTPPVAGLCGSCMSALRPWPAEKRLVVRTRCKPLRVNSSASSAW